MISRNVRMKVFPNLVELEIQANMDVRITWRTRSSDVIFIFISLPSNMDANLNGFLLNNLINH